MAKSASKSKQAYLTLYKSSSKWASNRKRKLLKQQKLQPNNKNLERALQDIRYRRRTPTTPQWSHSAIAMAKLFKYFTGRADKELFSSNPKVQQEALQRTTTKVFVNLPTGKVDFSVAARAFVQKGSQWK